MNGRRDTQARHRQLRIRRCPERHYQLTRFKHWAYHHGWTCHLCCRYSINYVIRGVSGKHYRQCHADLIEFGGEIHG